MEAKRAILMALIAVIGVCAAGSSGTPGDDQVAAYLKEHHMLGLLEVQLEDRIGDAKDNDERAQIVEQLSDLYLEQLRLYDRTDPYRELIVNRALSLVSKMGSTPMYELRIELLIESYLSVEPKVELARLELLDPDQRTDAINRLVLMKQSLKAIASKLDIKIAQTERLVARSKKLNTAEMKSSLSDLRRYRSLAHYYHAWSGYSLAVLKNQHVPSEVFVSFGWLLGAQGERPQFSVFNETTLEYEHVARSAIGVALCYAQSDDAPSGISWAKFVAQSEHAQLELVNAAEDRLVQILAQSRDWPEVYELLLFIEKQRGEDSPMRVAQARYLALQSLEAMRSTRVGRGGLSQATRVAQYAIEQLVAQGEIGHVLDLYRRFDSLPMVADSFITNYAQALGELNQAEQAGDAGRYATVAGQFARALESSDADRFPEQRDDCTLKLAYSEIRAHRAAEAIKVCEELIQSTVDEQVIEEARWMLIAALESIGAKSGSSVAKSLEKAVRQYIAAYQSTPRSAKLILRYAMQGTVDPRVAIDTLGAILDEDPIAIPARRTLVQLKYKQLRANRFTDQSAIVDVLGLIRWIDEHEPDEIADQSDARARMGTLRIGLDLALRSSPPDIGFADELLQRATGLLSYDGTLRSYRGELLYRQIEIAVLEHRYSDAGDVFKELEVIDSTTAQNARILMFNDALQRWKLGNDVKIARQIVDLGSKVLARQTPAYPEPMGVQISTVAEMIAEAAAYLWATKDDADARDLALRVSVLVLDRGVPSEPGLRRTALFTALAGDTKSELESWLRLLAAYPSTDDRWYEARYESLRVLQEIDFARALSAYDQYRVLHPNLGPPPWNAQIAGLFGDPIPEPSGASNGESP